MEKKIKYGFVCTYSEYLLDQIHAWMEGVNQCFEPIEMSGLLFNNKFCTFDENRLYNEIKKNIMNRGRVHFEIRNGEDRFMVLVKDCSFGKIVNIFLDVTAEKESFDFDILIDDLMIRGGMFAYKCSAEDHFWQNMEDLSIYKFYQKSTKGLSIIKSPIGINKMVVDIEKNPGHSHNVFGVWFGAWHKMWFGSEYYQFISQERLKEFGNCYENKCLDNDVIRIVLYSNIWDYDNRQNRRRQLEFRKYMEIDKAAEWYRKNYKPDLTTEVLFKKGSHGGDKIVLNYIDEEGKSSLKSKAKYIKYAEISNTGDVLYEEIRDNI